MRLLIQCLGAQPHWPLNSVQAACAGMLAPERFRLLEEAGIDWAPMTTASERKWQLCLSQLLAHRRTHGIMQVGVEACNHAKQAPCCAAPHWTVYCRTGSQAKTTGLSRPGWISNCSFGARTSFILVAWLS